MPIAPGLLETIEFLLRHGHSGTHNLIAISLFPLGPPDDFSLYTSPECKAFEAVCNERGIRLVYEDRPSTATPFSENGFWRFVRRLEAGEFAEAGDERGEELQELIKRMDV